MQTKRKRGGPIDDCHSIRQLLLLTRAKNGWPQSRVAKALKTTATTYKAWERGQRPRVESYRDIARYCGVEIVQLVVLATAEEA